MDSLTFTVGEFLRFIAYLGPAMFFIIRLDKRLSIAEGQLLDHKARQSDEFSRLENEYKAEICDLISVVKDLKSITENLTVAVVVLKEKVRLKNA